MRTFVDSLLSHYSTHRTQLFGVLLLLFVFFSVGFATCMWDKLFLGGGGGRGRGANHRPFPVCMCKHGITYFTSYSFSKRCLGTLTSSVVYCFDYNVESLPSIWLNPYTPIKAGYYALMKIISILLISKKFSPYVERCHVLKFWELGFMDCVNHYNRMYLRCWIAKLGGSCPCNDITIISMQFNRNLEKVRT